MQTGFCVGVAINSESVSVKGSEDLAELYLGHGTWQVVVCLLLFYVDFVPTVEF